MMTVIVYGPVNQSKLVEYVVAIEVGNGAVSLKHSDGSFTLATDVILIEVWDYAL